MTAQQRPGTAGIDRAISLALDFDESKREPARPIRLS